MYTTVDESVTPKQCEYLIQNVLNGEEYWHRVLGAWNPRHQATTFSPTQRIDYSLPVNGVWMEVGGPSDPLTGTDPVTPAEWELAHLMNENVSLAASLTEARALKATAQAELQNFKDRVREYVIALAEAKEWCETGVNRHFDELGLERWSKTKPYRVTYTVVYTMEALIDEAFDEDNAAEQAEELFDANDLRYESYDSFDIESVYEA